MVRLTLAALTVVLASGCSGKRDEETGSEVRPGREGEAASTPARDQAPAAFDPKNLDKTLAWLAARKEAADATHDGSNALAAKEAEAGYRAALDGLKGKRIEWPVRVSRVKEDGAVVAAVSEAEFPKADTGPRKVRSRGHVKIALLPKGRKNDADGSGFHNPPDWGFPANDWAWVRTLRGGQIAVLSGEVAAVQLDRAFWETEEDQTREPVFHYGTYLTFHVAGGRVAPPEP